MNDLSQPPRFSLAVHALAVVLVCVTFPLIWMGGLVTTYDAGMAVPDWPGTYGRNLFLFPWTQWFSGPWKLFVEHGHRLFGATAGIVAIALVIAAVITRQTAQVQRIALVALLLVILQGLLGGARVLLDARLLALVHGCVGPAFFAFSAALAVVTSRRWQNAVTTASAKSSLTRSAFWGMLLAYGQLILGAHLRHPPDDGSPRLFQIILLFHVVVALALSGHVIGQAIAALRKVCENRWVTRPLLIAAGLITLQVLLGFSTLIVKYGWPAWLGGDWLYPDFTVTAQGFWSSLIVTAHVANGSLILALLTVGWLRGQRCYGFRAPQRSRERPDETPLSARLAVGGGV